MAYTVLTRRPDWIELGKTQALSLPIYAEDKRTLVSPTAGTFTLTAPDGTMVVSAQAVTIVEGVATYSVLVTSDEQLGERWHEEWRLTLGGSTETFQREAALVRRAVFNTLTVRDLVKGRHRNLDKLLASSSHPGLEDYIEAAWEEVLSGVMADGRYPYRLLTTSSLRMPTIYKALQLAFQDAAGLNPQGGFMGLADRYREDFDAAWKAMAARWDDDDDGLPGANEEPTTSSRGSVSTSSYTSRGWRR